MKTIGVIGGMSWHSTHDCYRLLNEETKHRLGGLHSAPIVLQSLDFAEIEAWQRNDRWDAIGRELCQAAQALERAGADLILIASVTVHREFDAVASAVAVPVLHIGDALADHLDAKGIPKAALLGTRFTMESGFLRERLAKRRQLETLIPSEADRAEIHRIIYDELISGVVSDEARTAFSRIVANLSADGAEDIILGCTELAMLVPDAAKLARFHNALELHARVAVDLALA